MTQRLEEQQPVKFHSTLIHMKNMSLLHHYVDTVHGVYVYAHLQPKWGVEPVSANMVAVSYLASNRGLIVYGFDVSYIMLERNYRQLYAGLQYDCCFMTTIFKT